MARAPFQVHVLPYRRNQSGIEYAIFKRVDTGYWQGVAGGGEDDETPLQAAQRETLEECDLPPDLPFLALDAVASIPIYHFRDRTTWPQNLLVIPQYSFGVDATGHAIRLSHEHSEFHWLPYAVAKDLLYWHDNQTNLWELNQRLTR